MLSLTCGFIDISVTQFFVKKQILSRLEYAWNYLDKSFPRVQLRFFFFSFFFKSLSINDTHEKQLLLPLFTLKTGGGEGGGGGGSFKSENILKPLYHRGNNIL